MILSKIKNFLTRKRRTRQYFKEYKLGASIFIKDITNPDQSMIRVGFIRKFIDESRLRVFIPSYAAEVVVYYDGINWVLEQV